MFQGTDWKTNTLKTAFHYPGIVFVVFCILNTLIWGQKSSGAVPFGTFVALFLMWFGISVPLVFVGCAPSPSLFLSILLAVCVLAHASFSSRCFTTRIGEPLGRRIRPGAQIMSLSRSNFQSTTKRRVCWGRVGLSSLLA